MLIFIGSNNFSIKYIKIHVYQTLKRDGGVEVQTNQNFRLRADMQGK